MAMRSECSRWWGVSAASLLLIGCGGGHPEEGTLVEKGQGVPGLPGGREPVSSPSAKPISGGTLLVTEQSRQAVAADPDRDSVFVVDLDTHAVRTVSLGAGSEPGRLAEDQQGRVYVATRSSGELVTIDLASARVVNRLFVCQSPRGVAYHAPSDQVYVACRSGELVRVDAAQNQVLDKVHVASDLRDVIVRGDRLLVTRFRDAEMLEISASGSLVKIFGADPNLTSLGRVPTIAWRTVAAPDSDGLIMVYQSASTRPVSTHSGGYGSPEPCTPSIVNVQVTSWSSGYSNVVLGSASFTRAAGPTDIAVSADGSRVALVVAGNSWGNHGPKLIMMDQDSMTPSSDPCGGSDSGDSPGNGGVEGEPVAVAFDPDGIVVMQSREPATLQFGVGGPVVTLSSESRADTGLALFHGNSGRGIACASCHAEGGEDGRVWEFPEIGRRRTQSLAGGVSGRAPFHWDGDLPDIRALLDEVLVSRMGGQVRPSKAQVTALSTWLDSVPAPRVAADLDQAAVVRGRQLFLDPTVGCATCHAGPLLTNNTRHDVGTGGSFVVPTLVGLAARPPFMHDGCAPTLHDRFGACGGGDAHGVTSGLSSAQIDDLVRYLETL